MSQLVHWDRFWNSRLNWALYQSWQPLLFPRRPKHNSSLAHVAPFSNTTPTSSFQSKRASGSCWPILKTKTVSVREKVHLSLAARRFSQSSLNVLKISFENALHTKKARLLYFQIQRDSPCSCSIFFVLGLNYRYSILLQKATHRCLGFDFCLLLPTV